MLVLSRKVGEQIVLPSCGVTISVVKVAGKQVRLGIVAPRDAPVHRMETWHRIRGPQLGGQGSAGNGSEVIPLPRDDLGDRLACLVAQRTGGRVRSLRVELSGSRLVIHGRAPSYHVRQLVHAAVFDVLRTSDHDFPEEVVFHVEVVSAPESAGSGSPEPLGAGSTERPDDG